MGEAVGVWVVGISLFFQFCCKPKTVLKNKVFKNKQKNPYYPDLLLLLTKLYR